MSDKLQSRVVAVLALSSLAMLILVLGTPFVFFDEKPGLPIYPQITVDYLEEEDTFIILINSVSGNHIYNDVFLVMNGVNETIDHTYTIERHFTSDSVNISVRLVDENDNEFFLDASISKTVDSDPLEFEFRIDDEENPTEEVLSIEDFPHTVRLNKVVE